jgi:hypothetical protein
VRNRRLTFKFIVPLLSVFLVITSCEVVYRISRYQKLRTADAGNFLVTNTIFEKFHSKLGFRYLPKVSFTAHWLTNQNKEFSRSSIQINNLGFVSPNSDSVDKPKGEFRIVVIGDSFSACFHNNLPWPVTLERILNADKALKKSVENRQFKVMNLGKDGIGIEQFEAILEHEAGLFSPDLILVSFITADIFRRFTWRDNVLTSTGTEKYQATLICSSLPVALSNPDCTFTNTVVVPQGAEKDLYRIQKTKEVLAQTLAENLSWYTPYPTFLNYWLGGRLEAILGKSPLRERTVLFENKEQAIEASANAMRRMRIKEPRIVFLHTPIDHEINALGIAPIAGEVIKKSGVQAISLLDHYPKTPNHDEVIRWSHYPHDPHLTDEGALVQAKAVYRAIKSLPLEYPH